MLNTETKSLKISIITAVFNREDTISRSIKSIQEQDYNNIEHIIIDGASTDNTLSIIKNLIRRNDVLISEKDLGIYDALNKGIQFSTGDIICFMHSDDFFDNKNVLSKINNLFTDFNVDIVYGNASFFKNDPTKIIRNYISSTFNINNLSKGLMPAHPSMFIKKHVYNKHGLFNIDYKIAGDFEWLCRISKDQEISSYKVGDNFIKMQYGGASTNGLKSLYFLNKEVRKALRFNNIKSSYFKLLFKYFKKISEFKFIN